MPPTAAAPLLAPFVPEPLVVSANRLTKLGGEKGAPGCSRKYAGEYLFGYKQAGSDATALGSALHSAAETLQETGEIPEPEGRVGTLLQAGAHLLTPDGYNDALVHSGPAHRLLVEYEHVGELPPLADGTRVPFVAYMDGHSPDGGHTATVVIQDLKTTSDRKYALVVRERTPSGAPEPYWLGRNIQAMFYAAILLCIPHQFRRNAESPWELWDPATRNVGSGARLRWIYFLTRGVEHAWDVSVHVSVDDAATFLRDTIMPLVEKMTALHRWRERNPAATLDEIDRNLASCTRRGTPGQWCGVGEHNKCNFAVTGTPIIQLLTTGKKRTDPTMASDNPQARLAELRARRNATAAAAAGGAHVAPVAATPPQPAAPPPEQEAPVTPKASEQETPAQSAPGVSAPAGGAEDETSAPAQPAQPPASGTTDTAGAAPASRRGRPKRNPPPSAPPGANINPPDLAVQALAKLTTDEATAAVQQAAAVNSLPPLAAPPLSAIPLEALLGEIIRRALATQKGLGL